MPMTPAHVVIIRHIVKFQLQDIRINLSGIVIAEKHWHECDDCKDKKDEADHTWDKGVITTPATTTSEVLRPLLVRFVRLQRQSL